MRVSELLQLEPVRHARARVVVAADDVEVSWVHSSEIYEIAPLLRGGEVLLTTGLGLVGEDADGLRRYVRSLAARGVAALALELGRTFPDPPVELVAACEEHGLNLISFDAVVPFVETSRAANEAVLDHEATALRHQQRIGAALTSALLEGGRLPTLIELLAELTGTTVRLVARDGHVVAQAGGDGSAAGLTVTEPLHLFGQRWGELVADGGDQRPSDLSASLAGAVTAVELAILRSVDGARRAGDARRALVLDLARGSYADAAELTARAAGVGLPTAGPLLPVAVTAGSTPVARLRAVVADALARWAPGGIAGEVGEVVAVVAPAPSPLRSALDEFADGLARAVRADGGVLHRVVADTPVERPAQLTDGLRAAIDGAVTADRLGGEQRVLLPADLAVLRSLRAAGDPALDVLVRTVLGPLLRHDARHRPALLPTLIAYVAAGRSKVDAADRLGIRRQTVLARLRRIQELLELDPDRGPDATAIDLAITAWRVRRAGGA